MHTKLTAKLCDRKQYLDTNFTSWWKRAHFNWKLKMARNVWQNFAVRKRKVKTFCSFNVKVLRIKLFFYKSILNATLVHSGTEVGMKQEVIVLLPYFWSLTLHLLYQIAKDTSKKKAFLLKYSCRSFILLIIKGGLNSLKSQASFCSFF